MCSAFFSHIENWSIAWTYSILYTCSTVLKQYSCPWRIHCVFLRNIPLIWVRYLIKAINYLGWFKTLFQVRVVSANQSKWSLGWWMGTIYPPTPADGRGSAPEKDWRMLPVRPSGPCCFAVARRPFLSCAVSAFIVLPFWARRHWEHVLASCVRPSGSCCFGICSKS